MVLGQIFSSVPDAAKATAIDKGIETATDVVVKGTEEVGGMTRIPAALLDSNKTVTGEIQRFLGEGISGYGNTVILGPLVGYATWVSTRSEDRDPTTRLLLSATAGTIVAAVYFAVWAGVI